MTENKEMSEQEAAALLRTMASGQQNVHSFFTKVIQNPDTTRIGNLNEIELGISKLPMRTIKELELFSGEIIKDDAWKEYFQKLAEVQTSTSLSKDAILLKLSVTAKKELADTTPKSAKKENKGWFKGKKNSNQDTSSMGPV